MLREKIVNLAAAAALVLAPASAFAWSSTTSTTTETPGHQMQEHPSVAGSPGASGYAPGHQSKQFSSRDTVTSGSGLDKDQRSERSVTTQTDNGTGSSTSRTTESHTTTR